MVMERQDEILPLLCVCFHFTEKTKQSFGFALNGEKIIN